MTVAILAQTLGYLQGGGHFWVYLNWALGLRSNGVAVRWVESIPPAAEPAKVLGDLTTLRDYLQPFGLAEQIELIREDGAPLPESLSKWEAQEAEVLVNFRYGAPPALLRRYRRPILIDIDPGLTQLWVAEGQVEMAPHFAYVSISERMGQPGTGLIDLGFRWHHVYPVVDLEAWRAAPPAADGRFTTITHWQGHEYVKQGDEFYDNTKRAGFLPLATLPQLTTAKLGLAACYYEECDGEEMAAWRSYGWQIEHSHAVTATPAAYQSFIHRARGELSVSKPSSVRMQNAWVSDRTVCFLASGRPAVVQDTGPSPRLDHAGGLWRFRDLTSAAAALDEVERDYLAACQAARATAELLFDARRNTAQVLSIALA